MIHKYIVACALLMLLNGCQQKTQPLRELHTVVGKLLIDGEPAVGASLKLQPIGVENPSQLRGSGAIVKEDGSFIASTYDQEDGVPPGKYSTFVFWLTTPEGGGMMVDRLNGVFMNPEKPVVSFEVTKDRVDLGEIRLRTKP